MPSTDSPFPKPVVLDDPGSNFEHNLTSVRSVTHVRPYEQPDQFGAVGVDVTTLRSVAHVRPYEQTDQFGAVGVDVPVRFHNLPGGNYRLQVQSMPRYILAIGRPFLKETNIQALSNRRVIDHPFLKQPNDMYSNARGSNPIRTHVGELRHFPISMPETERRYFKVIVGNRGPTFIRPRLSATNDSPRDVPRTYYYHNNRN